jgi:glycine/sarcosine N-methyltransferase
MAFYEEISKHYDKIFPASQEALNFYTRLFNEYRVRSVLDAACGSGEYLRVFSQWGLRSVGIDLVPGMVAAANRKSQESGSSFQAIEGSMQQLSQKVRESFDAVICMGNSLVHLPSLEDMEESLSEFHRVTNPKGLVLVQIVNYDRILDQNVKELPTITNPDAELRFVRKYEYDASKKLIHFNTHLTVGEEEYKNSIPLFPLRKDDLIKLMEKAGYRHMNFYGNFKGEPWTPDSFATIVVGLKA